MSAPRTITTRYAGTCGDCNATLEAGTLAQYGGRGRLACIGCDLEQVPAGPTTRERREARAERLRGWADGRATKAAELHARNDPYRGDIAFNTQPGHIPERARVIARTERAWEHSTKAADMARRADSIEHAAAHAIYDDDPDAIERLRAKLERLEAERERIKARNADYRKTHRAELAALTPYHRDQAMPHQAYELQNLGGNISRQRARLARLERDTQ